MSNGRGRAAKFNRGRPAQFNPGTPNKAVNRTNTHVPPSQGVLSAWPDKIPTKVANHVCPFRYTLRSTPRYAGYTLSSRPRHAGCPVFTAITPFCPHRTAVAFQVPSAAPLPSTLCHLGPHRGPHRGPFCFPYLVPRLVKCHPHLDMQDANHHTLPVASNTSTISVLIRVAFRTAKGQTQRPCHGNAVRTPLKGTSPL